MRFIFSGAMESSEGGIASSIRQTLPSAELTILFASLGTSLSGSLKNQITKNVKAYPIIAAGTQRKYKPVEPAKKINANFHPSG